MHIMKFSFSYLLDNPYEEVGLVDPSVTGDISFPPVSELWTEHWRRYIGNFSITAVEQIVYERTLGASLLRKVQRATRSTPWY
jgi:hypothetical protein